MKRLLIALLFAATPALAQPYVLVGVGTESTILVGAGYQLGANISVEASGFRSRESGAFSPGAAAALGATATPESSRVTGFGAAVVGSLPVTQAISLAAKLGAYRLEAEVDGTSRAIAGALGAPQPADAAEETVIGFGFGAAYAVSRAVSLRAMYEQYDDRGALDQLKMTTVSVLYRF